MIKEKKVLFSKSELLRILSLFNETKSQKNLEIIMKILSIISLENNYVISLVKLNKR